MGRLLFGKQEDLHCITDVSLKGAAGEDACLGYKTSTYFFGAGVWVSDDGYVLVPKGQAQKFYRLTPQEIATHQPLPPYHLGAWTYVWGFSLWWIVALVVAFGFVRAALKKRRIEQRQRTLASRAVSLGPPVLATKTDNFIASQIMPLLRPGEAVHHQAYALDRDPSDGGGGLGAMDMIGIFAVLTSQRLFMMKTRAGAFGILHENFGAEWIERPFIRGVYVDDEMITVVHTEGATFPLFVRENRGVSNQTAFLLDVPRILGELDGLGARRRPKAASQHSPVDWSFQ